MRDNAARHVVSNNIVYSRDVVGMIIFTVGIADWLR